MFLEWSIVFPSHTVVAVSGDDDVVEYFDVDFLKYFLGLLGDFDVFVRSL